MKLIIGMGISGKAAAHLICEEEGRAFGYDDRPFSVEGVTSFSEENWSAVDTAIVAPGVPPTHPMYVRAQKEGVPIIGEAELALSRMKNPVIGITGTNGKTTLTKFLEHLFNAAGKRAIALGNVGEPFATFATKGDTDSIVVAELSSFQLETMQSPALDAAVLLNITPDHLDRYPSMEEYTAAKLRIRAALKEGGTLYLPENLRGHYPKEDGAINTLSESSYLQLSRDAQYWKGREQFALAVALAISDQFGIARQTFWDSVQNFQRPNHRMEIVGSVSGVQFVNDSKGTNLAATIHAVESLEENVVLIAGGMAKEPTFSPWKSALKGGVRKIVAYGTSAPQIAKELGTEFAVEQAPSFATAVQKAAESAQPGDTVLLSPGCASFDLFRNYQERGDAFKSEVKKLI